MGNGVSLGEDQGDTDIMDKFDGIDTLGYRVLGVQPDSPASHAGLVSFFDFLVGANGQMLFGSGEGLDEGDEYDDVDFPGLLQEFLGKPLELLVYNIKNQETRFVTIVPNKGWGGAGLLGVTIRLDNYGGADERLIRVLSVEHHSPAAIAGLVPHQDYLLGTTTESFPDTHSLATLLQTNVDQVVELYVYNTDSDVVRVVALMPTWSWGGKGLLGAEVGTGYLHRLPQSSRTTEGSSVERKVRWVGNKLQPQHNQQQQQQYHQHDERSTTKEMNTNAMTATLEVEPQLEMEVVEGTTPEEANKTIQQVANHSAPSSLGYPTVFVPEKNEDKVGGVEKRVPTQSLVEAPLFSATILPPDTLTMAKHATLEEAPDVGVLTRSVVSDAPTVDPNSRGITNATEDAASFFAQTPPTTTATTVPTDTATFSSNEFSSSTFYASAFLPPPPIRMQK